MIEIEQACILRDTQEQVFPLKVSIPYTIEEDGFTVSSCRELSIEKCNDREGYEIIYSQGRFRYTIGYLTDLLLLRDVDGTPLPETKRKRNTL